MSIESEFKKLIKGLPDEQQKRLPEKIRMFVNRREHREFLECIALGAYLSLEDKISLRGYLDVDTPLAKDLIFMREFDAKAGMDAILAQPDEAPAGEIEFY